MVFLVWHFEEWAKGEEAALRKVAHVGVPRGQSLQSKDWKLVRHCTPGQESRLQAAPIFWAALAPPTSRFERLTS